MKTILDSKTYDVLKWIALIAIPSLSTFVGTIGTALDYSNTGLVTTIIGAAGVLLGSLIGVSSHNYNKNKES